MPSARHDRQLKLGAFLHVTGHHVAAWRHASSEPRGIVSLAHHVELARIAEQGLFDLVFLADNLTVSQSGVTALHHLSKAAHFEPLTLLSALTAVTTHIGLVATATTSFNEPYNLARQFASLDHLSGGRAGWNLVTSSNEDEAYNFGLDEHLSPDVRYRRGREFAEVVRGLWDSFEDDAFVYDQQGGVFFDPAKLHRLDHRGVYFKVRGPLNVPRSPQGRPVVVQAGSSEAGKELAAETAEVVFTAHQNLDSATAFYRDLKDRLPRFDRSASDLLVMPGIFPVVGATQQEADDKFGELQELILPEVGVSLLSKMIGFDLSSFPVDGPVPDLPPHLHGSSRPELLLAKARRENLSIRGLYQGIAGARGHHQVVGTPERIADEMQSWFEADAADGFNVMSPTLPGGLIDFVTFVVPVLQRRGLFRTRYEGSRLRDNLGLPVPKFRSRTGPLESGLGATQ
ncbi:LLM class flavin-dependent oxidoreductase [Sinorhizobium sp. BG8]|uniref:LLM class flavin-dependent oxidoreductase n=1 Tax=Sinorhizobium sp. BG8 TaxID=2613773 RepID=UPI00193CCA52|nr:LLM class flavin-dependent oxidoreductase [Sinorhizobium sp. BG8]QRM57805.1 LLM class flavin-dependent oxidoreductase [Sinorhizobium sp. BG8]